MHSVIDYSKLVEPAKHYKAINDVKAYLGKKKFDKVTMTAATGTDTKQQFLNVMSMFAGISGYPAHAWWKHVTITRLLIATPEIQQVAEDLLAPKA